MAANDKTPTKPDAPAAPSDAEAKLKDALDRLAAAEAKLKEEVEEHALTKASLKLAGEAAVTASKAASDERKKVQQLARGIPVNGADLVKRLSETHTPDAKLKPARDLLARVKRDEGRIASIAEVTGALAEAFPDSLLLDKCRQICEYGFWKTPELRQELPIEEQLLAAKG